MNLDMAILLTLATIERQMKQLLTLVGGIKTEVTTMSEKTDKLKADVEAIVAKLGELTAAIGAFPQQIADLTAQVATLQAQIAEDETAIDSATSTIEGAIA